MNNEQNIFSLGDVVTHKKGFAFKSSKFESHGVPVVKVTNFTDSSVSYSDLVYVSESHAEEKRSFKLSSGDIVIQTVGSWPSNPASVVGKVVKIPDELNQALLNQNAVILYPKAGLNRTFLFYLLKDRSFKGYIINTAQGAANQASISLDSIFRFQFFKKQSDTQRKIAAILTAYDDLIETNKRRIALLEKMAEELYREWFIRMRFPGHQNTRFVKGVPERWKIQPIGELCSTVTDGSHFSPAFVGGGRPMASVKDMHPHGFDLTTVKTISEADFEDLKKSDCLPVRNDILIAKDGSYLKHVFVWGGDYEIVILSSIAMLRPDPSGITPYFFSQMLKQDSTKSMMSGYVSGSALPRIILKDFKKMKLLLPTTNVMMEYEGSAATIYQEIGVLLKANVKLSKTRDLLLPRLISGKLSVENLDIQFPPSMQ